MYTHTFCKIGVHLKYISIHDHHFVLKNNFKKGENVYQIRE